MGKKFSIQDLDDINEMDLQDSINKDELWGLIDEEKGGIIGYLNKYHAKRIMDLLNQKT